MTIKDVEKIIKEEVLISAYNMFEDRPDRENEVVVKRVDDHYIVYQTDEHNYIKDHPVIIADEEEAYNLFLSKLRSIKTNQYEQLFISKSANRVLQMTINKTFVSRYEFEATYHELYKSEDGKLYSVLRIDPAPGGYGEEYTYIKEVYELEIDDREKSYSDEELLKIAFSEGKKVELKYK